MNMELFANDFAECCSTRIDADFVENVKKQLTDITLYTAPDRRAAGLQHTQKTFPENINLLVRWCKNHTRAEVWTLTGPQHDFCRKIVQRTQILFLVKLRQAEERLRQAAEQQAAEQQALPEFSLEGYIKSILDCLTHHFCVEFSRQVNVAASQMSRQLAADIPIPDTSTLMYIRDCEFNERGELTVYFNSVEKPVSYTSYLEDIQKSLQVPDVDTIRSFWLRLAETHSNHVFHEIIEGRIDNFFVRLGCDKGEFLKRLACGIASCALLRIMHSLQKLYVRMKGDAIFSKFKDVDPVYDMYVGYLSQTFESIHCARKQIRCHYENLSHSCFRTFLYENIEHVQNILCPCARVASDYADIATHAFGAATKYLHDSVTNSVKDRVTKNVTATFTTLLTEAQRIQQMIEQDKIYAQLEEFKTKNEQQLVREEDERNKHISSNKRRGRDEDLGRKKRKDENEENQENQFLADLNTIQKQQLPKKHLEREEGPQNDKKRRMRDMRDMREVDGNVSTRKPLEVLGVQPLGVHYRGQRDRGDVRSIIKVEALYSIANWLTLLSRQDALLTSTITKIILGVDTSGVDADALMLIYVDMLCDAPRFDDLFTCVFIIALFGTRDMHVIADGVSARLPVGCHFRLRFERDVSIILIFGMIVCITSAFPSVSPDQGSLQFPLLKDALTGSFVKAVTWNPPFPWLEVVYPLIREGIRNELTAGGN